MARLSASSSTDAARQAGEPCAVEAIDREGLLVTSEGALVRFLRAAPKNPLVMSPVEREQIGRAFGQLAGRLQPGQSGSVAVATTNGFIRPRVCGFPKRRVRVVGRRQ